MEKSIISDPRPYFESPESRRSLELLLARKRVEQENEQ